MSICVFAATAALTATMTLYPSVGVISDIQPLDDETEVITVDDGRNIWQVENDADDLMVGDIVTYIMSDCGSPADNVDDEIVPDTFRYIGYVTETGTVFLHGSEVGEVTCYDD